MTKINTVIIKADKERHFKFTFTSLMELEAKFGAITELDKVFNEVKMADLAYLFYVGLKWEDKGLSTEDMPGLLDAAMENHSFVQLTEAMSKALAMAMGNAPSPTNKK